MPYGFPSGRGLLEMVLQELGDRGSRLPRICGSNGCPTKLAGFAEALRYCGRGSVDALLEYREDLVQIGKIAIAEVLGRCEKRDLLFTPAGGQGDWYHYLCGRMSSPFDEFGSNPLGVITFNYDRSLEEFLFTALKHSYERPDKKCAEQVSHLRIVHVHGSLGCLPWQGPGGRGYGDFVEDHHVVDAAKSIKIIHEATDEGEAFAEAWKLIAEAERIVMLGFGYAQANVRRLRLRGIQGKAELHGSCFGLSEMERLSALNELHAGLDQSRQHRVRIDGLNSWDCLGFIRNAGWIE